MKIIYRDNKKIRYTFLKDALVSLKKVKENYCK